MAEPATTLVHGLKYEGWSSLAREMGAAMVSALNRNRVGPTVIVPVPTTEARERRRGYNQAQLLAEVVARGLAIPLAPALVRDRGGPTQVSLPPSRRRANVRGAFLPVGPPGPHLEGARVLLVDDVLTTGATAGEAAIVLREMGASEVTALAFARALPSWRDAS
jgi:ComF family protein